MTGGSTVNCQFGNIIGLDINDARKVLNINGYVLREVNRNDHPLPISGDHSNIRINVGTYTDFERNIVVVKKLFGTF